MTLRQLNGLDRETGERELLRCCGSTAWARQMASRRPFADIAALRAEADRIWRALAPGDWLEAFAAHPRIGAGPAGEAGGADDWSLREQAGMEEASDALRRRVADANRAYEARFGFIYVVCAAGRTGEDLLETLERRLHHSSEGELAVAAEEQRKITQLRLTKLIESE